MNVTGVTEAMWVKLKRTSPDPLRSAVTVAVAMFVTMMSLIWLAIGLADHQPVVAFLALIQLCGSVGALWMILNGRVTPGRMLWFFSTLIVMTLATLAVPHEGRVEQMFFPLITGIFLHCSFRREKHLILWLIATCVLAWGFVQATGPGFFFAPIVSPVFAHDVISPMSATSAIVMGAVNVGLFAFLAERYEKVLEREREKADRANAAKSEFLAAMSHEIRTPMNGVLGMAEILGTTELNSSQRRGLSVIRDSGSALLRIIDDILDISSVEAGRLQLTMAPTPLDSTLEGAIDTLRAYAASNGVQLRYQIDGSIPRVIQADDGRLRQIVINLLGNAIKFTGRVAEGCPREVTVACRFEPAAQEVDKGRLQIDIRDTGIGIPKEFLPKLFEPFGRSEAARKAKIGGTGLGLAIVKRLVDLMGGTIRVTSELGKGTTVTLSLPVDIVLGAEAPPRSRSAHVRLVGMSDAQSQFWRGLCAEFGITPAEMRLQDVTAHFEPGHDIHIDIFGLSDERTMKAVLPLRCDRTSSRRRTCIFENADSLAWTHWIDDGACLIQSNPVAPSEARRILEGLLFDRKDSPAPAMVRTAPPALVAPAQNALRILVAEDDETNRLIIEQQLRILGFDPTIVADGTEAITRLEQERFDILLTDCQMPIMDGFELTRSIRQRERETGTEAMPIIAITANALRGEGERCINGGMTDYLAKPVRSADLKRTLADYAPKPRRLN